MIKEIIKRVWKLFKRANRQSIPSLKIPHSQYSIIVPTESWNSTVNERLIDISLQAIRFATKVDHTDIAAKMVERPLWPSIWPGEHYKLLSGLVQVLEPTIVVEIGTATGYSALSMKKFIKPDAKIYSFDIVPWQNFPNCILTDKDFTDGTLEQVIDDLTDWEVFLRHQSILSQADFVFIDAAKDGVQEQIFIDYFQRLNFKTKPIFMFDDIRLMNMITIWNKINKPKLDVTSFGHWAGTGLVDWTGS